MKTASYIPVLCLALTGIPAAWGHHSLAAEYDQAKPIVLNATVTGVDWRNPHAFLFLTVKGEDGAVVKWQCELGSPNQMARAGWHQNDAKPGDEIVVNGILAKDGSKTCSTRNVKFKDGRPLFGR